MSAFGASGSSPDNLKKVAAEIKRKRELATGLGIARKRQGFMLPSPPEVAGYEFERLYAPATEISGDFYDFIPHEDGRVGVLIGDVCGHGIEAAIVMGLAKKSLSIFARRAAGPAEALKKANDDLYGDLDNETFLTAIYVVLDPRRGSMKIARAGHPMPVLFNSKRKPPYSEVRSRGMMIGMAQGKTFTDALEEVEVELRRGDLVFLYTDGLIEAHSPTKVPFGLDRALGVLERHARSGIRKVLDAVKQEVDGFTRSLEAEDDITLIAFRRKR